MKWVKNQKKKKERKVPEGGTQPYNELLGENHRVLRELY